MNSKPKIFFAIGFSVLLFVFFVVSLSAVMLLLGMSVSRWVMPISILVSMGALYILLRSEHLKVFVLSLSAMLAILLTSFAFGSSTFDSTYDGNSYHKTAIGALKNGWNPVYEDIDTFNASERNTHQLIDGSGLERKNDGLWVNTYPKASWLFAANLYKVTGNIETGKAINLIMVIVSFLFAMSLFYKRLGMIKSVLIAGLLAFGPVAVAQMFGYFNDGAMGNFILTLIILLTMTLVKRTKNTEIPRWAVYAAIGLVIVLVINMKFTGLAYAAITVASYWVFLLVRRNWKEVIALTLTSIIAVLFGLAVVGASSYVKNTVVHNHPLYPLMGQNHVDIMTHNQPASYENKSGIHKFFESNFGSTANILRQTSLEAGDTNLKIPFTISMDELKVLGNDPDVRQAGYGVWFGGILILSFGLGVYLLARYGRKYKKQLPLIILPLVSLGVIAVAFDNSWWARYLPHLHIFPVIVLFALLLTKERIWSAILAFALLFNIVLTFSLQYDNQHKFNEAITTNISIHLPCNTAEPAEVFAVGYLSGAMYNLWDRCENIELLGPDMFTQNDTESSTRLVTDIYLMKN